METNKTSSLSITLKAESNSDLLGTKDFDVFVTYLSERFLDDKCLAIFVHYSQTLVSFESMFNNILSDSSSINSISEMYFNFFKPTFEFIFKQLKPKNMDDLYFASKKAYVMMMVSLILLARNLNMVVNACCHNTAQICGQIELFDQDIELNKINECLVLINPKIKLNTVFNLTTPEIPANLLNLYIKFYKKRLENPMMKNSLIYLDSINENLMGLSKVNLNSLRSILKYLVINVPKEIQG